MIKDENYIVIQGFMLNQLRLKGNELLIYSIIYGFTQGLEEQAFTGTLSYLEEWTNSTKQGVLKSIKSLLEKGLIEKKEHTENGVKKVEYYTTKFNGGSQQSLPGGSQQSLPGGSQQSLPGGSQQSLPNNNININIINNIINNNIQDEEVKKEFLKYVDYRKERKKPLTKTSVQYALNCLERLSGGQDRLKVQIIRQSIERGWLGLFTLQDRQDNFNDDDDDLTPAEWLAKYSKGGKNE